MTAAPELLAALRAAVGEAHVRTDPDVVAGQVVDWTGRFQGATPAVGRPGRLEEGGGAPPGPAGPRARPPPWSGPAASSRSPPCCARAMTPSRRSCRKGATPAW